MSILLRRSIIWSANKLPPEGQYNTFGFDGTDDYIDFGNDASLQLTNNITVSVWVKTPSTIAIENIVGKYDSATNQRSHLLQLYSGGRFRLLVSKTGGTNIYEVFGTSGTIVADTTYFVTYTIANQTMKIFVNGALHATGSPLPSSGIFNSSATFKLGRETNSGTDWSGDAANLLVFNRVLSDSEILNLYNSGEIPYYETLPTSLTSGNVLASELSSRDDSANDLSGNGNNGTKNGGVSANGSLQTFASYT